MPTTPQPAAAKMTAFPHGLSAFPYSDPKTHKYTGIWYVTDSCGRIVGDQLTKEEAHVIASSFNSHARLLAENAALVKALETSLAAMRDAAKTLEVITGRTPCGDAENIHDQLASCTAEAGEEAGHLFGVIIQAEDALSSKEGQKAKDGGSES